MNVREDKTDAIGLSVDQAARLTTMSTKTIRRAISRGELPSYKAGTRIVLKREDVEAWLFAVPNEPTAPTAPSPRADLLELPGLDRKPEARKVRRTNSNSRAGRGSVPYARKQSQHRRGSLRP